MNPELHTESERQSTGKSTVPSKIWYVISLWNQAGNYGINTFNNYSVGYTTFKDNNRTSISQKNSNFNYREKLVTGSRNDLTEKIKTSIADAAEKAAGEIWRITTSVQCLWNSLTNF